MKKFTWILYAAIILLFTAGISTATILDFEGLTGGAAPSGAGYDDFNWGNFYANDGLHNSYSDGGYVQNSGLGTASVTISASVGSLFNFYGADFQNGSFSWTPSQMTELLILGIGMNNTVGSTTISLPVYGDFINLTLATPWENLTSLIIRPTDPTEPGAGAFNMDNFSYTTNAAAPVPEPATVLLLGLGLLGLVGFKKKFRK